MSKRDILEYFKDINFAYNSPVMFDTLKDMLDELESENQEYCWISVKERLPERQKPVLVYVPSYSDEDEEYIGHVAMSYYTHSANGGYWAGTDGNVYGAIGIIHEPSHWMPLPEPPKEDG